MEHQYFVSIMSILNKTTSYLKHKKQDSTPSVGNTNPNKTMTSEPHNTAQEQQQVQEMIYFVYYYDYIHLIFLFITIYIHQQISALSTNHSCPRDDERVRIYFHFDYERNAFRLMVSMFI